MYGKLIRRLPLSLNVLLGKYYSYSIARYRHHNLSFSQEGEDLILKRIFELQENGFYVDVGAHHPQRFSNTYLFYLKGWRGINIDPMPESMDAFNKSRPEDINLELAIANNNEHLTYFQFNEPALNSFSEEISKSKDGLRDYRIISQTRIKPCRLSEILEKHLPLNQSIDFLTIDVEGLDLEVLMSNNWAKYKPYIVLVEDLNRFSINKLDKSKICSYMIELGYDLYAKTVNTLFFIDVSSNRNLKH